MSDIKVNYENKDEILKYHKELRDFPNKITMTRFIYYHYQWISCFAIYQGYKCMYIVNNNKWTKYRK